MNATRTLAALLLSLRLACESHADDAAEPYEPTPENLAAREWFRDAKFGIFIHWGCSSVLENGEWVMQNQKIPVAEYKPRTAARFNPVKYDPVEWVELFKRAGARYATITSKHHDGFAIWDSEQSDWDLVDATPYGRDALKPLANACRDGGLKLFLYHSHLDWTHPDYFPRGRTGRHSGRPESGDFDRYLEFMNAQLAELLSGDYGEVGGIWFDGWWDQRDKQADDPKKTFVDWRLRETYDLIHRLQPTCLIGNNHHVAPFAGEDFQMFERDLPGQNQGGHSADSVIGDLPLESCDTIANRSWGYNANATEFKSPRELVHYLVRAAGMNANLLLNIGPKPDGSIRPEEVQRLESIGAWLAEHGESIYGTRGGPVTPQAWGVSTAKEDTVYLHVIAPPDGDAGDWATLEGTAGLLAETVTEFDGAAVEHERTESGDLKVRLPRDAASRFDTILVLRGAR